jgi:hypothetical protein
VFVSVAGIHYTSETEVKKAEERRRKKVKEED